MAYKASQKGDLIDGIDEFVDDLTVLPPSIWDPTTRLDPPEKTITIVSTNWEGAFKFRCFMLFGHTCR